MHLRLIQNENLIVTNNRKITDIWKRETLFDTYFGFKQDWKALAIE